MTSKQRSYLKSLAVNLDTIFQIGKGGITEELCSQLLNALNARELIKIKTVYLGLLLLLIMNIGLSQWKRFIMQSQIYKLGLMI